MKTSSFIGLLLSQDIDKPENSELLTEIVNLWVTIRGFSMAASWLEEYKNHKDNSEINWFTQINQWDMTSIIHLSHYFVFSLDLERKKFSNYT